MCFACGDTSGSLSRSYGTVVTYEQPSCDRSAQVHCYRDGNQNPSASVPFLARKYANSEGLVLEEGRFAVKDLTPRSKNGKGWLLHPQDTCGD